MDPFKHLPEMIIRAMVFDIALSIVLTAIGFGLLYLVIKNGVRDGIKEAMQETRSRVSIPSTGNMPDMRANR